MKRLKFLRQITLSESEKDDMFAHISQKTGLEEWKKVPVKSPYVFAGFFNSSHFKFVAAAMIVFILTGTAAFASKALPGDFLYPVKINVLEKVPDALAWSSEAKARRNSKKVESRIKEFEALANQGRLSDKKAAGIDQKAERAIVDFDRNLDNMRASRDEARSKLNSDLKERINDHKESILDIKRSNSFASDSVMEKVLKRADKEEDDTDKVDTKKSESKSRQNPSIHKGNDIKIDLDVENERDRADKPIKKNLF